MHVNCAYVHWHGMYINKDKARPLLDVKEYAKMMLDLMCPPHGYVSIATLRAQRLTVVEQCKCTKDTIASVDTQKANGGHFLSANSLDSSVAFWNPAIALSR